MAAEDTVVQIIGEARDYANSSFDQANGLVGEAVRAANAISYPNVPDMPYQVNLPEIDRSGVIEPGSKPEFDDAGLERPDKPELRPAPEITVPDFDAIEPPQELDVDELFNYQPPNLDLPAFTGEAPTVRDVDVPDAPMLSLPERPELIEVSIPPTPSIRIPGFDPERPGERPEPPPDAREIFETSFDQILPELRNFIEAEVDGWVNRYAPDHHQQMQRLESRLAEMIDGGTAMPESIEQRLYERARARNEASRRDVETQALERAAQMGHTLPPGVALAAGHRAAQEAANANAQTSAEIAIEQARLEQQNIQFALQTSLALRQLVLNTALQYAAQLANLNGQAIQYASAVAQSAVELYNARVRLFQVEVEYFRAQAAVYETELRAAFADLERFEAEVRLEQLKGSLNEQQVNLYRQQLEGERTRLGLYAEQVRAEMTKLDADRAQIEAFNAQVQAYVAQVGAKEVEFRAYTAALQGDQAKVQGYASQVDAYRARLGAEGTKVQAEAAYADAVNTTNQSLTEIFRNEIVAYGTEARVKQSQFEGEIRAYLASLDRYRADLGYILDEYRTRAEGERLRFERDRTVFDRTAEIGVETARSYLQRARTVADAAISGAGVYGNIAQSAVSAQNTMVTLANETLSTTE